jgi:hypothetical protein
LSGGVTPSMEIPAPPSTLPAKAGISSGGVIPSKEIPACAGMRYGLGAGTVGLRVPVRVYAGMRNDLGEI